MYPNEQVAGEVTRDFIPVKLHVKERPEAMQRFGAQWTPTLIVLDEEGKERHRWEGYLPADEFLAQLELALAKVDFAHNDFGGAERHYRKIIDTYSKSDAAPEALYWAGVSKYKASNDPSALQATAKAFQSSYSDSAWAKKASVWGS